MSSLFWGSPKPEVEWKYEFTRKQDNCIYAVNPNDPNSKDINCNKLYSDMTIGETVHSLPLGACMAFLQGECNEALTNRISESALAGDVAAQRFLKAFEERQKEERSSPKHKKQSILKRKDTPPKKASFNLTGETSESEVDEVLDMKQGDSPLVQARRELPKRQTSLRRYSVIVLVTPSFAECMDGITLAQEKDCYHHTEKIFKDWRAEIGHRDALNGRILDAKEDMNYFMLEMRKLYKEKKSPARFIYFAELIRKWTETHCYKFGGMTDEEIGILETVGTKYNELQKNNPTLRSCKIQFIKRRNK
jgi:hypothetical protein